MRLYSIWLISLCVALNNMPWIARDGALSLEEMQNNANIVYSDYSAKGYNINTIAAICGNMQAESTINPERNEKGGSGYGLVQWTPKDKLIEACGVLGLSPYTDGNNQLTVLDAQLLGSSGLNSWYTSAAFIRPYYSSGATNDMVGISGNQFKANSMGWDVRKLTIMFMVGYERPDYDPAVNHISARIQYADYWYQYFSGKPPDPPDPPVPPKPFFTKSNFMTIYIKRRL